MSDLISRQEAIKAIDDLPNCYNGYSDTYDKSLIIGVIEELPSAEPNKWIPCSERLPEKNGNYFVTIEDDVFDEPFIMTLWYGIPNDPSAKRRDWYMSDQEGEFYFDGVTAWVELPKAYRRVEA